VTEPMLIDSVLLKTNRSVVDGAYTTPRAVQHGDGRSSRKTHLVHHHLANHRSINLVIAGLSAPVYLFMIPIIESRPEQSTIHKAAAFDYD